MSIKVRGRYEGATIRPQVEHDTALNQEVDTNRTRTPIREVSYGVNILSHATLTLWCGCYTLPVVEDRFLCSSDSDGSKQPHISNKLQGLVVRSYNDDTLMRLH